MRVHLLAPSGPTPPPDQLAEAVVVDGGRIGLHPLAAASGLDEVEHGDAADLLLVPGRWQWYEPAQRAEVLRRAAEAGAVLGIWSNVDPALSGVGPRTVVVQAGSHRSRSDGRTVTVPVFFGELQLETFGAEPDVRDTPRARVGFCGQTRQSAARRALAIARRGADAVRARRLDPTAGDLLYEPEPLASHLRLRRRALASLARHPGVDTEVIARDRYRGGAGWGGDEEARRRSREEFVANVVDTDHTLCVRGAGNFSTRLYEALCLGRLPIIVDTDGLLPWPEHELWTRDALVVDAADVDRLGDAVAAHHRHLLADEGLAAAQLRARRFWVERLSRKGFLAHLDEALAPAVAAARR